MVDETILIYRKSRKEIDSQLETLKFRKFPSGRVDLDRFLEQEKYQKEFPDKPLVDSPENPIITVDYQYLVGMAIYNLTSDKITELTKIHIEKESQLKTLQGLTPETIWSGELVQYREVYERQMDAWTKEQTREYKSQSEGKGKGKAKRGKRVVKKKVK